MARTGGLGMVVMVLLSVLAPVSWGCSCSQLGPSKCPSLKEGGPVFVGTVTDIENPPDERRGADQSGTARYRFRLDENINGVAAKEVDVYSGRGGGDCSYHFQLGHTYLVNPWPNKGRLTAGACSETQPIETAGALLSELRARRDGKRYASIYGLLERTQQPYASTSYEGFDHPLPDVRVQLIGGGKRLSTKTNSAGIYRFYDVPSGTYRFSVDLASNLELTQSILSEPIPPLELPAGACYQRDLEALPTGRIRGRVLGPEGAPIKNVDVALFRADRFGERENGWWEYQGEGKGYFEFKNVTPGTYVIVAHNSDRPDPDEPFARTFYPGAPDLNSATPVVVGDGEQILNADIHVKPDKATRVIKVRVNWMDKPVPDDVYVHARASDGEQLNADKVSPGVYAISIFRDEHYTVFAEQDCGLRWEGNTGRPIGQRETPQVSVDGSDERSGEINLSLQTNSCTPYPPLDPQ
jgi:hypothetical protein